MAKTVLKIVGVILVLVGIAGFVKHDLLGAHLMVAHNLVHLLSGLIALYVGFAGSISNAKAFCVVFGAVYLLLGIAGLVLGNPAGKMLHVGPLILGSVDHGIHILLGVLFLIGGLFTKEAPAAS
jgi:Domain of unknown function (DUF4383)